MAHLPRSVTTIVGSQVEEIQDVRRTGRKLGMKTQVDLCEIP